MHAYSHIAGFMDPLISNKNRSFQLAPAILKSAPGRRGAFRKILFFIFDLSSQLVE